VKIGDKFALIIFSMYGIYAAVDSFIQYTVILPAFERLEGSQAEEAMDLVMKNINRDLVDLSDLGTRWQLEGFEPFRPPAETLKSAGVDFAAVVDGGSLVLSRTPNLPEPSLPPTTDGPAPPQAQDLTTFLAQWRSATTEATLRGLILTASGPAMIVMGPMVAAAGAPAAGGAPAAVGAPAAENRLVLGRYLTSEVVEDIGRRSNVPLRIDLVEASGPASSGATAPPSGTLVTSGPQYLEVSRSMPDPLGRPVLRLAFPSFREISEQAHAAVRFALFSLLLAGSLVVLAMLALLHRVVVLPLQKIESFFQSLASSDDLTSRVKISSHDEFGRLGSEINIMVDRLEKARREIVDQSFESGLAEMARGVLHNIGNALTPVKVSAGSLVRSLRALPVAEASMATAELERSDLDPTRRGDLERFLQLFASTFAERTGALVADASRVDEGLMAVQSMLQEQSRFASTSHLVERIAVTDLVNEALRLVPPDRLARMEIVRDPSLMSVGILALPRTALVQVIQNLVLNGCEAVPPGGRGVMQIRCDLKTSGEKRILSMDFQDDGMGIAPEDIQKLFSKGFSTKSSTTNSGLGLHWCTNVLQAMEGSLRADSEGANKGATFHLELPLP
jgi:signal transduction histidine kinase